MIATAGAIPLPATNARNHEASGATTRADLGHALSISSKRPINPLSSTPAANVEATTINEMTWVYP